MTANKSVTENKAIVATCHGIALEAPVAGDSQVWARHYCTSLGLYLVKWRRVPYEQQFNVGKRRGPIYILGLQTLTNKFTYIPDLTNI